MRGSASSTSAGRSTAAAAISNPMHARLASVAYSHSIGSWPEGRTPSANQVRVSPAPRSNAICAANAATYSGH